MAENLPDIKILNFSAFSPYSLYRPSSSIPAFTVLLGFDNFENTNIANENIELQLFINGQPAPFFHEGTTAITQADLDKSDDIERFTINPSGSISFTYNSVKNVNGTKPISFPDVDSILSIGSDINPNLIKKGRNEIKIKAKFSNNGQNELNADNNERIFYSENYTSDELKKLNDLEVLNFSLEKTDNFIIKMNFTINNKGHIASIIYPRFYIDNGILNPENNNKNLSLTIKIKDKSDKIIAFSKADAPTPFIPDINLSTITYLMNEVGHLQLLPDESIDVSLNFPLRIYNNFYKGKILQIMLLEDGNINNNQKKITISLDKNKETNSQNCKDYINLTKSLSIIMDDLLESTPTSTQDIMYQQKARACIFDAFTIGEVSQEANANQIKQQPQPAEQTGIAKNTTNLTKISNIKNTSMYQNLKGKIILKVEASGEAYYIHPSSKKMYYLGRPNDAFSVMREQGVGIKNADLKKIPVGLSNLSGADSDKDGLPDIFEDAIGTDKNKIDSDGDSFNDKTELSNNYNPKGSGKLSLDNNFSLNQKGKILLQVEGKGEAWYVNPADGKRYFLGRPADAFEAMKNLGTGISNNNFSKL